MAISFVGGGSSATNNNGDASIDLTALTGGSGSTALEGDLVIFGYGIGDADNVDLNMTCNTSGFNEISDIFANGTQDANLGVYWKFMTSSPDTSVVGEGSLGGNDTGIVGAAMVFRGVKTVADGGPFAATRTENSGTTGGNPDPPSITFSGSGVWTVIVGHAADPGSGTAAGFTAPANYTTNFITTAADDTTDANIGMGYRTNPSSPENPAAMTASVSGTAWAAVTMALAAAPSATPLVIQDTGSASLIDNVGLTQHNVLAVQDTASASLADNVALTQHNVLAVADTASASLADNLALTQHNVLAVQDTASASLADNLDLVANDTTLLEIQDAADASTIDNVSLTQHNVLAVADTASASLADNMALTQHNVLAVQDTASAVPTENLDLVQHNILVIQDVTLASTIDNVSVVPTPEESEMTFSDQGGGAYYSRS